MKPSLPRLPFSLLLFVFCLPVEAAIDVPLTVQDFADVPRTAEPVRSGVPIPESAGLLQASSLRLLGPSGAPVPARIVATGRWKSGPADPAAPVRWVLVDFVADVAALGSTLYRLTDGGPGPSLPAITVAETAGDVTVTTGPARFLISKTKGSLIESAWLDDNGDGAFDPSKMAIAPASDTGPFVTQSGVEYRGSSAVPLSVKVEDAGPGRATLRLEGFHQNGGTPLLRYVTRITFFAGKSDAHVEHALIEGRVMGTGNGNYPGGVTETPLDRAGLRLRIATAGGVTARVAGDAATPLSFSLGPSANASVRQRPSTDWQQPLSFEIWNGSTLVQSGERARQALVDLEESRWGVTVATRDFWRKSPERLLCAGDGTVTIELPSEPYTIYQGMGYTEDILIALHSSSTPYAELRAKAQGLLKDPLFAVAAASWYVGSGAFGDLRPAPSAAYPQYDAALEADYQQTLAWIDEGHAFGLMNWLDLPKDMWDSTSDPAHLDWGNSYYDAAGAQIREFARRGEYRWLRDLAFPIARHNYSIDCYDTDDPDHFTNGISGARGEVHRGIFTGEYHYLESLWPYYYLTGSARALERGLQAARSYTDRAEWENDYDLGFGPGLTTRMIAQKLHTLAEGYLASGDASLRAALVFDAEDFIANWGTAEGFIRDQRAPYSPYADDQAFMATLLYLPSLYEYWQLTGSSTARQALITLPQRILVDHRLSSNPNDPDYLRFYNQVEVTPTGGGTYQAAGITPNGNSDDYMYDQGVHGLVTALCRASLLSGNGALLTEARTLYEGRVIPSWPGKIWDKEEAQMTLRAAAALECMDPGSAVQGDDYLAGQGLGPSNPNEVRVFSAAGSLASDFYAYGTGSWGTNVAAADIDGSAPEILTGPGPGDIYGPQARAFLRDGTPKSKVNFYAYGTLRFGVNVAGADLDGDGFAEIVTGAGPGAVFGPHVRAFNFDGGTVAAIPKATFFAYGTLRYGVNAAGGDLDGDAFGEIVTGPGPGAMFGPQVRAFDYDGIALASIAKINFNAFQILEYGANVASDLVDADAYAEILAAPGPGSGASFPSELRGFNYDSLSVAQLPGFDVIGFAGTSYGGRVGAGDVDGSGPQDLVAGAGRDPSADSTVKAWRYDGAALSPIPIALLAFPGATYGVNVTGGSFGY